MVDLHAKNSSNNRREGKVKILMDRTPNFIKSKFWSVLGNSNDLINGITTKVKTTVISYINLWCYMLAYIWIILIYCYRIAEYVDAFVWCINFTILIWNSWIFHWVWVRQLKLNQLDTIQMRIASKMMVTHWYHIICLVIGRSFIILSLESKKIITFNTISYVQWRFIRLIKSVNLIHNTTKLA